jgi:two-component system, LytTR family, response regulator
MNIIEGERQVAATIHAASRMRVVSFDANAEVHASLRSTVEGDSDFALVGESREWTECEALLDRFVPELLLANIKQVPQQFLEGLSSSAFPILVGLQAADRGQTGAKPYGVLSMPLDPTHVHNLLDQVRSEICRRKADELARLLQRYVACVARCEQYLAKLRVENDRQAEVVEIERILSFSADGNYIRVHTKDKTFEIRETMTGISSKLDPSRFVRVHRSFIVNLSQISSVISREGSCTFVVLSNGTEVPIGPNYRAEFSSSAQRAQSLNRVTPAATLHAFELRRLTRGHSLFV